MVLRLKEENISFSCNSNLMLCTDERAKTLAGLGLDHILTSLLHLRQLMTLLWRQDHLIK